MKIEHNCNNLYHPNFRAITLSKAEIKEARAIIGNCTTNMPLETKKLVWTKLYNIFIPHIEKEAASKSGKFCIYSEVLSEMKVLFFETLSSINLNNNTIHKLTSAINKHTPTTNTTKDKYLNASLNKGDFHQRRWIQIDTITIQNSPEPESAIKTEEYRNRLALITTNNSLSKKEKSRLAAHGKGKPMAAIAREENVCPSVVQDSIIRVRLKMQRINGRLSAKYKEIASQLAEQLNCTEEKALSLIIRLPRLANSDSATIEKNITGCSELLKTTRKDYIENFGLKNPSFLCFNSENFDKKIHDSSAILKYSNLEYIKIGKKDPTMLDLKPETIQKYIDDKSEFLGRSAEEIIKTTKRLPPFLYTKLSTMKKYIERLMKVLKCSREEAIDLIMAQPSVLFYRKPKLQNTITDGAKILNCTESEFAKLCFKQQSLLTLSSETLKSHVQDTPKLLGCTPEAFIEIGKTRPCLFCMKPELIKQKNDILNYYKKIKNEETSPTLLSFDSNEVLYLRILAHLLNKSYGAKINIMNCKKFLPDYLKQANMVYKLEIPEDSVTKDFTKFVHDYSTKILDKNIFEFNIV